MTASLLSPSSSPGWVAAIVVVAVLALVYRLFRLGLNLWQTRHVWKDWKRGDSQAHNAKSHESDSRNY